MIKILDNNFYFLLIKNKKLLIFSTHVIPDDPNLATLPYTINGVPRS